MNSVNKNTTGYVSTRMKIYSASDALLAQPGMNWVVDQLIGQGSLSVFVGSPATKKTFSLISMGVCVSVGKKWLNFHTQQENVIFLDEDSGAKRISNRIGDALRGENISEAPFFYTEPCGLNLRNNRDIEELKNLVVYHQAGLLIIDTLANIMPGADENSVKDTNPVLISLRQVAYETNCAIVLLHHTNKGGDYRGSTAIEAAVDLMVSVSSNTKTSEIRFKTIKSRDTKGGNFSAIIDFREKSYILRGSSIETVSQYDLSPSKQAILSFLSLQPHGATRNEISHACISFSENTIKKVLHELISSNLVVRINGQGKGVEGIYGLPPNEI